VDFCDGGEGAGGGAGRAEFKPALSMPSFLGA
jgi:hypothetical protein